MTTRRTPISHRFLSRINRSHASGCWLWRGALDARGYGRIGLGGSTANRTGANTAQTHRLAYEMWVGPIPDGLLVCHRCDVPACVRPNHLFVGTHADNSHDAVRKGRMRRGDRHWGRLHPERLARGERNPRAKLTDNDVRAIVAKAHDGIPRPLLRQQFGVSKTTIDTILRGEVWAHVTGITPSKTRRSSRGAS